MVDSGNMVNSMALGLGHTANMSNSMANSMAAGLGHTANMSSSLANSMTSGLANTNMSSSLANSMTSGLANINNMTNSMVAGFGQFSVGRKPASELSPGSRKAMSALPNPTQSAQLPSQPGLPQQQQAFNITAPKNRKSGGFFGEEDDSETSMYFPPSGNIFRPDKDMMNQSQSPSQLTGFGSNFYSQGLNSFSVQQRGPVSGPQFQRNNAPTPTSMNPNFPQGGVNIQQNSPNRGVVSAIGQHRMMSMQKRPVGSSLQSTAPISSLASAFGGFGTRGLDSSQPSFDMSSDFPSLGNRATTSSNSLSSASRNYVGMVSKPVQEQTPEFQIQQEDFPALPGAQSTLSIFVSDPPTSGNSDQTKKQPINLISGSSYEQAVSKDCKFTGDKLNSGLQRKGIVAHPDGRITNIPQGMVADQFGIVGLLTFIKAADSDPNLVALAPGMDLTTLGLNLNSPDNLYSTFQSPWVDLSCRPQDIDFHVPAEYLTNTFVRDKLAPIKLNRYGEDLLFYLFYMNGGDVLQLAAAAELYNRDWRYHKEERVWITRAPGVEPLMKTNTYERGTYYFFDAQNWRKVAKEFHLEYDKLEERPTLPSSLHHNPNQPIAAH